MSENKSSHVENDLYAILQPVVTKMDEQVKSVRNSQVTLRETIDDVSNELQRISETQPVDVDLEPHVRRLINTKRRVVLISNIVQNAQERLGRLSRSVEVETLRKQALLQAQNAIVDVAQPPRDVTGRSTSPPDRSSLTVDERKEVKD